VWLQSGDGTEPKAPFLAQVLKKRILGQRSHGTLPRPSPSRGSCQDITCFFFFFFFFLFFFFFFFFREREGRKVDLSPSSAGRAFASRVGPFSTRYCWPAGFETAPSWLMGIQVSCSLHRA